MPKQFSEDFKRQAVDLYETTEGATLDSIASDLGIGKSTLSLWLQKYRTTPPPNRDSRAATDLVETGEVAALLAENRALKNEKAKLETERDILRQAAKYFGGRDELVSRFQFIDDHRDTIPVKWLCRVLDVARSSYYAWVEAAPKRAARTQADEALAARVRRAQDREAGGDPAYGVPRVTADLNDGAPENERVNHKRVARVMREHGLSGIRLLRRVKTTVPDPNDQKVADLVQRDFTADTPGTRYVGDITYLPIVGGKNWYLATVIDLCSRKLAGWALADHMRTELVSDALTAARAARGSLDGTIFHSDHGSVYTSKAYAQLCTELGVTQSMGAVGSSADNALAESFNAALKREVLHGRAAFRDEHECRREVFRWVNRYNTKRRHSYLGQVAPDAFESAMLAAAA
ncbi:IS3 family transposase [Leucobacter coleopterorum]|uniref:IS3 family transposase n=1 Tax=Leucobacter coleopterorum TaxID=2714933 RepID=A0ABX6JTJ3_9MICO|nr:IS3 family transposase [Leucobacter coleopterorum]QIM17604.1 IS3 family transposase [Leucobacter coleopterorum]